MGLLTMLPTQMALFTYEFMEGGVNWLDVASYVDIPVFEGYFDSSHQPAGLSIIRSPTWLDVKPLASVNVDWSRVLAVVVDGALSSPSVATKSARRLSRDGLRMSSPSRGSPAPWRCATSCEPR